ncbi:MAG TPA: hypothetical protein VF609_09850 [Flavisolibacter sp.]
MRRLLIFFLAVTIMNAVIVYFRDDFQFIKYSTYQELYGPCDENCREKWDDFLKPYSTASISEARKILLPLHVDKGSTLMKIQLIGRHLYARFHQQSGFPNGIIHRSSPLNQYKILSSDTTQKLWCGTWAQMFSFFCWSQNIVCRNVEIFKPGDHHVLNECYLPEQKQWVMVDLTSAILLATRNEKLLNVQDFLANLQNPDSLKIIPAGAQATQLFSGFPFNASVKSYYRREYPVYYYHITHTPTVYTGSAKLKRFFLPVYWYEIFSADNKIPFLFCIKLIVVGIWIVLGGLILVKRFHD